MVDTRYLLAALLGVPLIDATLLVFVAGAIGGVTTVLLVVLTGLVGMLLVRAEGRHTLRRIQGSLADGQPPTDELLDGAFLIAAGAFLLTPGLVTDVLGFLFVLPPTRYPLRELLSRRVVTPYLDEKTGGFASGNVYIGGFPGDDDGDGSAFGDHDASEERRRAESDGDTVDIGDDEYSVE
ncbi:FxsA family protein [Halobaculum sp. MBLA0143]|uniref:FxsA family protein n=1 Tax=Halobaculum sp. MBLA0143 TaxID=3079933 RepID=UPI003523F6CC